MPATKTTNNASERGLPDRDWDHDLSHLKVSERSSHGRISTRFAGAYRKGNGAWVLLLPAELPERLDLLRWFTDRGEFSEFLNELNETCKRLHQNDKQQKAEREAKWTNYRQRKLAARQEYHDWLLSLPIDAVDAYKEDPGRWVYRGGESGRKDEVSVTRWLHRKAQKHFADEARNVAGEIRDRHGLYRKTQLV